MDNALDNFNEVAKCASGLRKEPFEFVKNYLIPYSWSVIQHLDVWKLIFMMGQKFVLLTLDYREVLTAGHIYLT